MTTEIFVVLDNSEGEDDFLVREWCLTREEAEAAITRLKLEYVKTYADSMDREKVREEIKARYPRPKQAGLARSEDEMKALKKWERDILGLLNYQGGFVQAPEYLQFRIMSVKRIC